MVKASIANPKPDVTITVDYDTALALAALTSIGQIHYEAGSGGRNVLGYLKRAGGPESSPYGYTQLLQPVSKAIKEVLYGGR